MTFDPEKQAHLLRTKLQLGRIHIGILNFVEPAGIPDIHLISPQDLALAGAVMYAPNQVHHQFDSASHAQEMYAQLSPQLKSSYGLSKGQFIARYRPLIGQTDLSQGTLVTTLAHWVDTLPAPEKERLERSFAALYGLLCVIEPTAIPRTAPGVLLDYSNRSLAFTGGEHYPLSQLPAVVLEYGPGLAALHKLPHQILPQQQWIFAENNRYVNQVLMTAAGYQGLQPPQIIGREDGISGTTGELLGLGMTNRVGLIIASGIQEAGIEEITTGISQGFQLLHPQGLMAIRAAHPVAENQPTAETMIQLAQATFGTQALSHQFTARHPVHGQEITITDAIFQKK